MPPYELVPHENAELGEVKYSDGPSQQQSRKSTWLGRLGWIVAFILTLALAWRFKGNIYEASAGGYQQVETLRTELEHALQWENGKNWDEIDTLFVFGDSYTSTGDPMRSTPSKPELDTPFVDELGHFADAPNWLNFLTQMYNHTNFRTWNFAVGGSTVDENIVKPYLLGTSLRQQAIDQFIPKFVETEDPMMEWKPETSAFVLWFGVNDLHLSFMADPTMRPPISTIFESYANSVNALYHAGARNFLFLTVPPFDRATPIPFNPTTDSYSTYATALNYKLEEIADIAAYNARIFKLRSQLRANYSDVSAYIFDAHAFFARILETPEQFSQMADVTHTRGICDLEEGQTGTYYNVTCKHGHELLSRYAWTNLHATHPVHNATGARVVEDCFGVDGKRGFCL